MRGSFLFGGNWFVALDEGDALQGEGDFPVTPDLRPGRLDPVELIRSRPLSEIQSEKSLTPPQAFWERSSLGRVDLITTRCEGESFCARDGRPWSTNRPYRLTSEVLGRTRSGFTVRGLGNNSTWAQLELISTRVAEFRGRNMGVRVSLYPSSIGQTDLVTQEIDSVFVFCTIVQSKNKKPWVRK